MCGGIGVGETVYQDECPFCQEFSGGLKKDEARH